MLINWNILLEAIIAIGVVAFAVGQFTNGRFQRKDDSLDTASTTIDILQKSVDLLTKAQKDDHDQIIRLEEQLKQAQSENDRLTKIIENRNPDLEAILKEIRDFMEKLNATNTHQTNMLESQIDREKR